MFPGNWELGMDPLYFASVANCYNRTFSIPKAESSVKCLIWILIFLTVLIQVHKTIATIINLVLISCPVDYHHKNGL
ncbi:MAG: hypothetical protein EAZ60_12095 [Oscillatoriales cyanobacterium]|nr:MAG: hypothetical protein EAZ83_16675 [Oscillatoriales cyanobacterium]TAE93533.1 MAG: hypothetical protein EAZ79_27040 [Oscillatoriales cyanobacterium]TAF18433.1 MAG: hypothetical protein EAZ73_17975 [Oscillatoriales cyanobacterium]TAF30971.1 MAG: hypothetical protein EAZ69_20770 [Oscillatoriales cyanobacterium]TAF55739.1 MAG: hypothetical protein EAZ60_12095 [Oscillatoriales cyanobacterium]